MTLTEFLLARVDEDEERLCREVDWPFFGSAAEREQARASFRAQLARDQRQLAECQAKRLIIAEHPAHKERRRVVDLAALGAALGDPTRWTVLVFCETCGDPYFWDQTPPVEWPCQTLRALAVVYADHPDYLVEWRPDTPEVG